MEELQRSLTRITRWADTWRVRFGAKKCAVVVFGRAMVPDAMQRELAALRLTGFVVARASSYNFLGVRLDARLEWCEQVQHVRQRAHMVAHQIGRLCKRRAQVWWLDCAKRCCGRR